MTESSTREVICAACSTPGTGRFCASCGAPLHASTCPDCSATLSAGGRFCHRCGRPSGAATSSRAAPQHSRQEKAAATPLPWIIGAIVLVALLAFLGGSAFSKRGGGTLETTQTPLAQAGFGDGSATGAPPLAAGTIRGPDISQLSPQESADRLFNRVMKLAGENKTDSVLFFAPMAINAYQMLAPLNADQRYDMGRIAEVAGALPLAKAQADTILLENPGHLLGLVLGARIAALNKDASARKSFESKIIAAYSTESAKRLSEYERHAADISTALAEARQATRPAR